MAINQKTSLNNPEASKKQLIFILPNLEGGGAERVALNVLRHLDFDLFEVTLFLFKGRGKYLQDVPSNVKLISATRHGRTVFRLLTITRKLFRAAKGKDLIIGSLELSPTYLAWFTGLCLRIPVCGWVHIAFEDYGKHIKSIHHTLSQIVYPKLQKIIVPSKGVGQSLQNWIERDIANRTVVIANPIDPSCYHTEAPLKSVWNQYDEVFSRPVVIAVGRLTEQKGFDVLLRAHSILMNEGASHNLLILGEGPARKKLRKLANDLQIDQSVFMPGFVSNPLAYMAKARVFVLSSRFEGFGMVLLEAMLSGTPIVATDCPYGPGDVLENGQSGILVPVEDPMALSIEIKDLLEDSKKRGALISAGYKRVKNFYPPIIGQTWNQVLIKATERPPL
ncbi:Glycosyltransferase involved in cell wall biosynthesis OS=Castellaniella defragrans OX=75697 GN=HNR28_001804 PE=4 SV=1 [Castellaniella defragrans]